MTAYSFKNRPTAAELSEADKASEDELRQSTTDRPADEAIFNDKIGSPIQSSTEVLDEE